MMNPKLFVCSIALLCFPVSDAKHDVRPERWHGTLILAMVSDNDAVLAADSLVVRGAGEKRQIRKDCKIKILSSNFAIAITGVMAPLQEATNTIASDPKLSTKSLSQISSEWYKLSVEHLQEHSIRWAEPQYEDDIGGAIFLRVKRFTPIEYVQTRIQPIRGIDSQYRQMPRKDWLKFFSFKMNSDGSGEDSLESWFTDQTDLAHEDLKFRQDLETKALTSKELDAAAMRIMKGAIDADEQKAKTDPNHQVIIGGPIELLHFDRRTGRMHWVQNDFCAAVPPH